jgi:hypothetical protein
MHQFEDSKLPEVVEIPACALAVWQFKNWSKGTGFALVPLLHYICYTPPNQCEPFTLTPKSP